MKTTLDILWAAIKDIETGEAKTIEEDPVNGLLLENNKLTKINVSCQSAKYNNGKRISRPTIDSYKEIVDYIKGEKNLLSFEQDKDIIKKLKEDKKNLEERILYYKNLNQNLVEENRSLVEKNRSLLKSNKKNAL
jgi:hypothetical protein